MEPGPEAGGLRRKAEARERASTRDGRRLRCREGRRRNTRRPCTGMGSAGQTNTRVANATRDAHADERRADASARTGGARSGERGGDGATRAGGSGAGRERTELNDGEEPAMPRSVDIAVRKRDVVLCIAGRGGGDWPQDVAGVVDLDSIEPEGDSDRCAGNEVLVTDRRARVAEAGRLNLALELAYVFVIEGESTLGRVSRKRGRRGSAVGEVGQGGAGDRVTGDPGNGIGQVSDAGVGVDGWEIAGEARGDRCAYSRHQQPLIVRRLHVRVSTDRLRTKPANHRLDGGVARVTREQRAGKPDSATVEREGHRDCGAERDVGQRIERVIGLCVCECVSGREISSAQKRGTRRREAAGTGHRSSSC